MNFLFLYPPSSLPRIPSTLEGVGHQSEEIGREERQGETESYRGGCFRTKRHSLGFQMSNRRKGRNLRRELRKGRADA